MLLDKVILLQKVEMQDTRIRELTQCKHKISSCFKLCAEMKDTRIRELTRFSNARLVQYSVVR